MGKGGGGALSMWIREFTSLVFTQTIQAFIYAIVISIILYGMKSRAGISTDDNNAALGLMSTFALLSVFKVEEMSKRIFGLHDTKASPGNAFRSIAKTAFAAQLGKRVLNNLGKVTGGIGAITKARQDRRKLSNRLDEDMEDNGFKMGKDGKPVPVGKPSRTVSVPSSSEESYGEGGSSDDVVSTSGVSEADRRRMKNAFRTYQDKMSEINKQSREGFKSIASGFAETAGAGFAGTAGMIFGGADGNLDEAIQGLMAGAGVGDAIGQSAINSLDKAISFAERNYKRQAGMGSKALKQKFAEAEKIINSTPTYYKSSSVDDID